MATTDFKSVDDYISSLPAEVQPVLKELRELVQKVAPGAAEIISYQLPTFSINGNRVYVAGYRKHISVYPTTDEMEAAFEGALTPYKSGKGTLRFALDKPLPLDIIERVFRYILQARAKVKAKTK